MALSLHLWLQTCWKRDSGSPPKRRRLSLAEGNSALLKGTRAIRFLLVAEEIELKTGQKIDLPLGSGAEDLEGSDGRALHDHRKHLGFPDMHQSSAKG